MQLAVGDQVQVWLLVAAVCMLFVTVVLAISGAVWVVAKGQEAMKGLGRSIDLLRVTIHQLAGKVEVLDDKNDALVERVTRLEGSVGN